jgi:hypothetical protein
LFQYAVMRISRIYFSPQTSPKNELKITLVEKKRQTELVNNH